MVVSFNLFNLKTILFLKNANKNNNNFFLYKSFKSNLFSFHFLLNFFYRISMNSIFKGENFGEKIVLDPDYLRNFCKNIYLTKNFPYINPETFNLPYSNIKSVVFLKVIEFFKKRSRSCLRKKLTRIHDDLKKPKGFKRRNLKFLSLEKKSLLKITKRFSFLGNKKLFLFPEKIIGWKPKKNMDMYKRINPKKILKSSKLDYIWWMFNISNTRFRTSDRWVMSPAR